MTEKFVYFDMKDLKMEKFAPYLMIKVNLKKKSIFIKNVSTAKLV